MKNKPSLNQHTKGLLVDLGLAAANLIDSKDPAEWVKFNNAESAFRDAVASQVEGE